jgi:antitoxin ParD1/3/4
MSAREKRTFTLLLEQARYIDALVASGAYASASEVVGAGLRALQERETSVERWLQEEVVPVYDAMQREPDRAVSGDEVLAAISAHHTERLKRSKRGI